MRQVTREDFEILTKYHTGEIRYYVDVDNALPSKRKATRVTVKRKYKARKKPVKRIVTVGVNPKSGRTTNSPVQLGLTSPTFREGTKSQNWWRLVQLKFEKDPTKVIGRTELVNGIVDSSVYTKQQIGPFVSECLKAGILRYREAS